MRLLALAMAVGAFFLTSLGAQDISGTWTLNVEKSKLVRPIKSRVASFTKTADGYKYTSDTIRADDGPRHEEIVCDGKAHESKEGTATCTVVNGKVVNFSGKAGNNSFEQVLKLSSDGKTFTTSRKGVMEGKPYTETLVYDRR